jgi:hypothetical protein
MTHERTIRYTNQNLKSLGLRQCSACHQISVLENFSFKRQGKDRSTLCRACAAVAYRTYRQGLTGEALTRFLQQREHWSKSHYPSKEVWRERNKAAWKKHKKKRSLAAIAWRKQHPNYSSDRSYRHAKLYAEYLQAGYPKVRRSVIVWKMRDGKFVRRTRVVTRGLAAWVAAGKPPCPHVEEGGLVQTS